MTESFVLGMRRRMTAQKRKSTAQSEITYKGDKDLTDSNEYYCNCLSFGQAFGVIINVLGLSLLS
jgi:hypothetical protein